MPIRAFASGDSPISVTSILIHLIGAVCLLLWSTRMIKNGISRAFGTNLRQVIMKSSNNRFIACLSGVMIAALMQSSTAASMLVASFVKNGFINTGMALSAITGANIGTALAAQVLTCDLSWLSPVLLTIGVITYNAYERSGRERHVARVIIGLGLMTLSLALIRDILEPLKNSQELPMLLKPLNDEPLLALAVGAIVTLMLYSSLASVLVFAAFAAHGLISLNLGLHLAFGANAGQAFLTYLATRKEEIKVRRITAANLVARCALVLVWLPFLHASIEALMSHESDAARQIVDFHTAFNLSALIFLPFIGLIGKLVDHLYRDDSLNRDEAGPQYLDENAIKTPVIALACAARETLRMAEIVEKMLDLTMTAFEKNDDRLIQSIQMMDNKVDRLNQAIKLYLTRLSQESFDPKEADRYIQILTFSTNLEYCGDVIDKSLLELAVKKMRKQESFSEKGFAEIKDFHHKVLDNLRLAQSIFLSEDHDLATQLIENKKLVREAETETSKQHFKRLHERKAESVATSSMHLDIIRDLRRINSYITSVAFTIIDNQEKHKKKRSRKKKSVIPPAPLPPPQDV